MNGRSEDERAVVRALHELHRHHTGRVDGPNGCAGPLRQPLGPAGKRRGREVLGDHERGLGRQRGHGGGCYRILAQPECVRDRACGQLGANVAGPLEDEGVVPIAVVAVRAAQALVDEQRQIQRSRREDRRVEGGIFVTAHGVVHPVQDMPPAHRARSVGDRALTLSDDRRQVSSELGGMHGEGLPGEVRTLARTLEASARRAFTHANAAVIGMRHGRVGDESALARSRRFGRAPPWTSCFSLASGSRLTVMCHYIFPPLDDRVGIVLVYLERAAHPNRRSLSTG